MGAGVLDLRFQCAADRGHRPPRFTPAACSPRSGTGVRPWRTFGTFRPGLSPREAAVKSRFMKRKDSGRDASSHGDAFE